METPPDSTTTEIICRIDWTRDEIREFFDWHDYGFSPANRPGVFPPRRVRIFARFLIVVLITCVGLFFYGALSNSFALPRIALLVGVSTVLAFSYVTMDSVATSRSKQERLAMFRSKLVALTGVDVHIAPDGVTTHLPDGPHVQPWANCAKVEETRRLILWFSYTGQVNAIPKRCFRPDYDRKHATIMKWFRAGGGGSAAPVFEALKDLDVPCKSCGYNLRGIRKLQCPECGRELDPILL